MATSTTRSRARLGADDLDAVFRALADDTRRRVLAQLGRRPASVTELAAPFPMALPSFVQHLRVLEQSGLVSSVKVGRVRTYRLEPQRMAAVEGWLAAERARWTRRLDQLDDYVLGVHRRTTRHDPQETRP